MAKQKPSAPDKGAIAEEALREYFRNLGSFVIRGVPVRQGSDHVSDADLWIYTRTSAHARHISIVDIKNKKRGKAFERAIWVKGLQAALGADEAIIASQGAKDSVQAFSDRLRVRVISRAVFEAIVKRFAIGGDRLFYEDVDALWRSHSLDASNIKARMDAAKSELSKGISFRSLNQWLDEAAFFLRLAVEREKYPGPLTRACYLCCSLVAIGADYLGKEHSLSEYKLRYEYFRQGLLFGGVDPELSKDYLEFAENAITEFFDPTGAAAAQVRSGFDRAVDQMPVEGLAEFFAKPNSGLELLKGAMALEASCFAVKIPRPADLPGTEAKIVLGLVSDYAGLRRRDVLGVKGSEALANVGDQPTQAGFTFIEGQ